MQRRPGGPAAPAGSQDQLRAMLKRGYDAYAARDYREAGACCRKVLSLAPNTIGAHFLVGLIATQLKDLKMALRAFGSVTSLDSRHAAGWAHMARIFTHIGQLERAETSVEKAVTAGTDDPMVEDLIGTVWSALGDQHEAKGWHQKAVDKAPKSVLFNANLASSLIFLGENADAEKALDRVLAVNPNEPQSHWRKSALKKAADHSHIDALRALMAKYKDNNQALSFVAYAAGKEYEDLEEWDKAFECFAAGARAKRSFVTFDDAAEEIAFDALKESFNTDWMAEDHDGFQTDAPIFIVGQPRTGTTLVERIITSHSAVHSAGELQQLRLSVRRHIPLETTDQFSAEIVRASAGIDPARIGEAYMRSTKKMQGEKPRFVDKMPVNYLYVPLILKALPGAKIIHLVRDPVDSCFSSFKQLFAEAYYHSYDLEEMARHHVRYQNIMQHWRDIAPGRFLDIRYEDVVNDLELNARTLIEYLGLPWEDACLDFHKQTQAVTTASAVQVRQKVHTKSVGRWKKYEQELAPATEILRNAGLLGD